MKVRVTPRAGRDLESIRDFYFAESPNAADRVAQDILRAIALLRHQPDIGIRSIRQSDVRSKLVTGLPYRIHYRIRGGVLEVLHVRHTSRRPWPAEKP